MIFIAVVQAGVAGRRAVDGGTTWCATVARVTGPAGYLCRCCGEHHEGLPFSYGVDAPVSWREEFADDPKSMLSDEQCIILAEHFFVRARIVIPVLDAGTEFDWGVWVSLSRANFERALDLWTTEGRESEPPYFGWLSTALPYEPTTVSLKTHVHTQPVGKRPLVELEHTNHPLAVEQHHGITLARVQEIAERVLHAA